MLKRALPWLLCAASLAGEPALPKELQAQWARFQAALAKDDVQGLLALTRFPLRSNEFGGDMKTPEAFKRHYKTLFSAETRACMQAATPQKAGGVKDTYTVSCEAGGYPIDFVFSRVGATYLFTRIDNVNE